MSTTNNAPATQPEIANLATTRKEQTAAKKAHPAGKAAPAKKAPAKAPAKKAAPVPTGSKLRWTLDGERDSKNRVAQTAVASDGAKYVISGADDVWKATVTVDGKSTVLAEGGHTKCYLAAVKRHAEALAA